MTKPDTHPCQLYLLTPPVIDDMAAFLKDLEAALSAAPVACLQIRLKDIEDSALIQAGQAIVPLCHRFGVNVLMNDRPDLVAAVGADGAHIGQDDMDYFSSRELLGGDAIIGVTCHNSKSLAFKAAEAGADYVAFGASSVAIGGITVDNAAQVIEAGADFIAVSAGVWNYKEGPAAAVSKLSALCSDYA